MASNKQGRSAEEWLQIINECRRSGLSDREWCEQHDISLSTFYNTISRLRKKSYTIPKPVRTTPTSMDLTSHQDVVQINLCDDDQCTPADASMVQAQPAAHLDNPYKIELTMGNTSLRV